MNSTSTNLFSPTPLIAFIFFLIVNHNGDQVHSFTPMNANCQAVIPSSRFHDLSFSKLYLKDDIAEMIDLEFLRLTNKQEYEKKVRDKNKAVTEPSLPSNFESGNFFGMLNPNSGEQEDSVQKRRDTRMAKNNPEQYCADRCVSAGYCDVYEDMLEMSPTEVLKFCKECVLSDEEEPCDIPEKMLDSDNPELSLRP